MQAMRSGPDLPLSCTLRRYSGEHAAHAHDHAQVLIGVQGRMELEVQGRAAFVDAACGIVIPAGAVHGYLALPGARFCVIDAAPQPGLDRLRRFAVPAEARHGLGLAAGALEAEGGALPGLPGVWTLPIGDGARVAAQFCALLGRAPRILARRALPLERLQQAVSAALHEPWPTARMAALCHMSPQRFHARWLELAGSTPQAWLRGLRLDAAAQRLARGQRLEDAALACGYATASALASALRRERGTGARGLRRQ
ncbi:AraC family transcriptional regulator [Paracidovorax konjaci]|uniref:AraC-type DNA-binding protein n=1 Tax=Paracidovorax konjaci TaxID=32040 RepID=A0A1I1UHY1_9BURK|nr:AraC family transcriptional regulator [Paracidovorax konjaci]SFD70482.1 AraC-type DNA-binding protein [Paracidovorax konjaci]